MTTTATEPPTAPPSHRPLLRTRDDRVVAGVAGGLGRWLDIDPVILRVTFVVLTLFGGVGVVGYLIGYLLIPDETTGQAAVPSHLLPDLRRLNHQQRALLGWGLAALIVVVALAGHRTSTVALLVIVAAVIALTARAQLHSPVREPQQSAPTATPEYAFSPPPGMVVPPSAAFTSAAPTSAAPTSTTPAWVNRPITPATPPVFVSAARRRTLNVALVSASVLAMGVYLLIGRAGAYDTGVLATTAVGLLALGIGLVATAWRARSRWALTLGALMTVFLLLGSAVSGDYGTSVGSRVWRPTSVSDIPTTYKLGAGNATLDLRQLGSTAAGVTIRVEMGAGRLIVTTPADVPASASAYVGLGEFQAFGLRYSDNPSHQTVYTPGWTTANGVHLIIHLRVGNVEVDRG